MMESRRVATAASKITAGVSATVGIERVCSPAGSRRALRGLGSILLTTRRACGQELGEYCDTQLWKWGPARTSIVPLRWAHCSIMSDTLSLRYNKLHA